MEFVVCVTVHVLFPVIYFEKKKAVFIKTNMELHRLISLFSSMSFYVEKNPSFLLKRTLVFC